MENDGTDDVDIVKDASRDVIKEQDALAKEFLSELLSIAMYADPSGSAPYPHAPPDEPQYASLPSALPSALPSGSTFNEDDDRGLVHYIASGAKLLEHAPPGEPIASPGLRLVDSSERPAGFSASNHEVALGAFPVVPSSRNTAASQPSSHPTSSFDSTREITNESYPGTGASGSYTVEAQLVSDGNEEEVTMMVVEAKSVTVKWYQRPYYQRLLAFGLLGAVVAFVVLVVLVVRPQSGATGSQLTSASPGPTTAPTSVPPESIACDFLFIPNVTKCRSTFEFQGQAKGYTIPSEIGLLTQLTVLNFFANSLTSTIPSEIGLLTQLNYLSFYSNSLTSTIPSEIGHLTKLTFLGFFANSLTSTIPSEIGLLKQLTALDFSSNALNGTMPSSLCSLPSYNGSISIDCGEVTCASGCCSRYNETFGRSYSCG